jgi:membrane fusion protein (multidrug efflux system)
MHLPPPAHAGAISSFSYSAAPQLVLTLLLATFCSAVGCGKTIAAPAIPAPEVEVASVVQKDVPIFSEWVATLDGYVNAQIQALGGGWQQ